MLITLGIIGVVAAMTMPALISGHNKSVVETRLKRIDSVLNSALKLAEKDYAEPQNWEAVSSPQVIKTFFMPYLPGSKFISEANLKYYTIYTSDGSSSFSLNGGYSSGFQMKTGEIIKVNGAGLDKEFQIGIILKPNKNNKYISGKDYFVLYMDRTKGVVDVKPWAAHWNVSCNSDRNTVLSQCKSSSGHSALCTLLIECNGWKIPDDYPIRF